MRWCVVVATGGGVGIVGGQGEGVLTVILQGTYRIPSALRSQALSGPLSTEVGDSSGNVGAVSFFLSPHASAAPHSPLSRHTPASPLLAQH